MIAGYHWTQVIVILLIALPSIGLTCVTFRDNWRSGGAMLLAALTIPLVPFLIAFLLGVSGLTWGDYTAWYLAGLTITCFTAALLYLRKRS